MRHHQIIDSFIFSQSLKDHECFTLNDFWIIGIFPTSQRHLIRNFRPSFFLVIFVDYIICNSSLVRSNQPFKSWNHCRIKQPSEICGPLLIVSGATKNHDHCLTGMSVAYLRQYTQSVYQFPLYRSRKD